MTVAINRTRRRAWRRAGTAAAVLVPFACAGLPLAALADPAEGAERVPVALVNADEMVTQTDPETGEETPILAGRQLVTELTGSQTAVDFDWQLTNKEDAVDALAAGDVYAVLTIPDDFSKSIVSIQGDDPQQARIEIRTDDAHSYVAAPIADALGQSLVSAFGSSITENFVVTVFDEVGGAFADAADGAEQLADGAEQAAAGAAEFAAGVDQYTDGVSDLAGGISQLADGAEQLAGGIGAFANGVGDYAAGADEFSTGLRAPDGLPALVSSTEEYTDGVAALSAALSQAVDDLQENPTDPLALATVVALSEQLEATAAGGAELAQGTEAVVYGVDTGSAQIPGVLDGAEQLADGAVELSAGAEGLAAGARDLAAAADEAAAGAEQLSSSGDALDDGASELAGGVAELADGSEQLADGLREGSESFSDTEATERMAAVASDPIGYDVATDHPVGSSSSAIATALVPYAAWIGALVVFLIVPLFPSRVLASSASTGRLLLGVLARAGMLAAAQAIGLVAVLHVMGGVDWGLLPATLAYSLLLAAVFTVFHAALVAAFGRPGLVGSFLALGLQFAASGVLLPAETLAPLFGGISPYLPLNWAATWLQQLLTSGSPAPGMVVALVLFGVVSLGAAHLALRRTRRTAVLDLIVPA